MNIAILGANGYIGRNLINKLLAETDHTIVALSPNAESMPVSHERLTKCNVDVSDTEKLHGLIRYCDAAYYLIHMMAQKKVDFAEAESQAAMSFCKASNNSAIRRVNYRNTLQVAIKLASY